MSEELPDSPFESVEGDGGGIDGDEELGGGSPMDRLFDGNAPGPSVGELKADYEMPQWMAVLSRGIMRVATGSGVPPIAEIVIGSIMGFMGSDLSSAVSGSDDGEEREEESADAGTQQAGAPPGVDI